MGEEIKKVIISNLPSIPEITPECYLIIEKPGQDEEDENGGTYKGTIGDLQQGVSEDIEEIRRQITALNNSLVVVTDNLTQLTETVDSISDNLTQLAETVDSYGTRIASLEYKIPRIESNIEHIGTTIDGIETNIQDMNQTIDSMQSDVSTISSNLTDVTNRVTTAETNIAALQSLVWNGTRSEWDALTEQEKAQYHIICIKDE